MTGWDERISQLEAEFPGWHIWRSSAGRWWATRTGSVLRREDLGTGRVMTVDADDEKDLGEQLVKQSSLDFDLLAPQVQGRPLAVDERLRQAVERSA